MIDLINVRITQKDAAETIRDRIGEILKLNLVEQKGLAEPAEKPVYDVPVFVEASRPWELLRDKSVAALINVTFEADNIELGRSSSVNLAAYRGVFNIDVIASAKSRAGESGDRRASFKAQQVSKLCRSILSANIYAYLGLRGVVHNRTLNGKQMLQPNEKTAVENTTACRITLEAIYNETGPEQAGEVIEEVGVTILDESGEVLVVAEYSQED